jgi:hypothetical protein
VAGTDVWDRLGDGLGVPDGDGVAVRAGLGDRAGAGVDDGPAGTEVAGGDEGLLAGWTSPAGAAGGRTRM